MDESWRMKMGVSGASASMRSSSLEPEDFDDVFGGPPKSLLARKLSADFSGNDGFYSQIFKPLDDSDASDIVVSRGFKLPEFVIPEKRPKKKSVKSIPRSKSTSSSVMSLNELYQLNTFGSTTVIGEDDVALSSYASKLRPINIPKGNNRKQDLPAFGCPNTTDNNYIANQFIDDNKNKSKFGYPQTVASPETITTQHTSFNTSLNGKYDMQLSLPSPISSLCQGLEDNCRTAQFDYQEHIPYHQLVQDDDVINSYENYKTTISHVMEVNNANAIDIDEAIAWAKEKFHGCSSNDG